MRLADTIAAIATAAGRAGIGVVRISGPGARRISKQMTGRELQPRQATLCSFVDVDGVAIDSGIAILFSGPNSYTGEDVLELQGHGGGAVLRLLLQRCCELGARLAEPGEFTRRAFLNDKLDLLQAESVADLIDASSAAAARSAMRSLGGEFSRQIHDVRDGLIELRAQVEAAIDFPEEDIDFIAHSNALARLTALLNALAALVNNAVQGSLLRQGVTAVLLGPPNVGKSSLMNRLAEEEVAIVTAIPGTTRDALRHELVIEGVPIHVVDTAGLRESDDPVERAGINRTWREIGLADIALEVVDASSPHETAPAELSQRVPASATKILIINKIDLIGAAPKRAAQNQRQAVWVSAKTGRGLELLRSAILEAAGWQCTQEAPFMARERHVVALRDAQSALAQAGAQAERLELFAEELRQAQRALGAITGETTADDLLGEIFSRFCVGK